MNSKSILAHVLLLAYKLVAYFWLFDLSIFLVVESGSARIQIH